MSGIGITSFRITKDRLDKITNFLSVLFPTERDRLFFESVYYNCKTIRDHSTVPRIELEMPNNKFIIKYMRLYGCKYFTDANTPAEIHSVMAKDESPIVVDLISSSKTPQKQLEFLNKLYGVVTKPGGKPNHNYYIFLVRKSLYKNNALFRCYSMDTKRMNDLDVEFTKKESEEYVDYLMCLINAMCLRANYYEHTYDEMVEAAIEDVKYPVYKEEDYQ